MMNPIGIKMIQELDLKRKSTTKELLCACGDIAQFK